MTAAARAMAATMAQSVVQGTAVASLAAAAAVAATLTDPLVGACAVVAQVAVGTAKVKTAPLLQPVPDT